MRNAIYRLDGILCRHYEIFEFSHDQNCILRLQLTHAPHPINLHDTVVNAGEPIMELHLWNERLPLISSEDLSVSWASHTEHLFIHSLRLVATYISRSPHLVSVCAVGGVTSVIAPEAHTAGVKFMQNLGFTVLPYYRPAGRFGEFWENFYAWWLIWAYNPASLKHCQFFHMQRTEIWMSVDEFQTRYLK
jgi:hypothetical protein